MSPIIASTDSLLDADDVVPTMTAWLADGMRSALVTLIATDGPGPRAVGAQMAVRGDGQMAGYLSGGCLERNIVTEALEAMAEGRNRRVRFGGPDGYFDMTLPCGAALDLYIDQSISAGEAAQLVSAARQRRVAVRTTDLDNGGSAITLDEVGRDAGAVSRLEGRALVRVHRPPPRLVLLGSSPLVVALARLARHTGLVLDVATPDEQMVARLAGHGIEAAPLVTARLPEVCRPDCWTASALAFHEHDSEPELLTELLSSPGFYIGALGSRAVHRKRVAMLIERGVASESLRRLTGSIGAIPGAKTQSALAIGILSDVLSAAREHGVID